MVPDAHCCRGVAGQDAIPRNMLYNQGNLEASPLRQQSDGNHVQTINTNKCLEQIHNAVELVHFSQKKNGGFGQLERNDTCISSKGLAVSGTEHVTEKIGRAAT